MNKHFRRWCCRSRLPSRLLWGHWGCIFFIGLCWPKGWCARLVEKITKETNGLNRLIFIIASCISRLVTREMRPEDGCFRHTDYITLFCHFCSINALLDAYHFSLGKKEKILHEVTYLSKRNLHKLFFHSKFDYGQFLKQYSTTPIKFVTWPNWIWCESQGLN